MSTPTRQKAPQGLAPRAGAAALLRAVLHKRRPLDEAFAEEATSGRLAACEARDRAFARAIAATTLRRLGSIDHVLDGLLEKPLPARAGHVRNILRIGLAELLFMGVAPHAAVGMAVESASASRVAQHFKALVNAILRRADRERDTLLTGLDMAHLDTPDWLFESWSRAYGEITARAIAEAHYADPPLDLSVKHDHERQYWADELGAEILPTGSLRLRETARVDTLPGFDQGAWWVQDAAAAIPARLLGQIAGAEVLDLCAAPGGKTVELAAMGARVTALDRSRARLERVSENLTRVNLAAELVTADAALWQPKRQWARILLDAPCSATGTARRHPDVLRLKTPGDRDKLAALQARILAHASGLLAPGGILVYCTCSLEAEEGPRQIDAFLAGRPGFARLPIRASEVGDLSALVTAEGDMRSLPCHLDDRGGMDGFYAARLIRSN
ncbi:transcription antitermination factor NusB [Parvibaculum sp.]|uniref:RsmB/NOP family class I SAM-dependent RNA methyltransferase n=1 Tax=Parvibaculum sp. TaxID=2024848 RepID=UPI000C9247E7|nr:transcription antitermination factor NusB [Parvibaculum sp.]MAB13311.1 MFS transporter [Parvibaculum sp.]